MEKKKEDYCDKQELLKELILYRKAFYDAQNADEPRPQINNRLAKMIMDICHHYSFSPNFINYPYREEMVGDAIENVIKYVHNFDREKAVNPDKPQPFAYITRIAWGAFVRRIKREKKEMKKKAKYIQESGFYETLMDEIPENDKSYIEYLRKYYNEDVTEDLNKKDKLAKVK